MGAEMVLRTIEKMGWWSSDIAFETYSNGRYIDIEISGTGDSYKRIEVKSWNKIYPKTFIKQFVTKDLVAINSLTSLIWVFDAKYPTVLKDDILTVLKSANGLAALNSIGFSKAKQLFPNDDLIDETNFADRIITNLGKDEFYSLIFKLL